MASRYSEHKPDLRVTTANGLVALEFTEEGVMILLPGDEELIPWAEWEHLAHVYGKRPKTS